MPSTTEQRLAAERWFLQRGLPAVLRPGVLVQRVWTRSAPALAGLAVVVLFSVLIVAATGKHSIDIDGSPTRTEWFVIGIVLLVLPTVAAAGRLVSRTSDPRLRAAVSTGSLGIAAIGGFYGGPSSRVLIDLVTGIVLVVLIFVCTATGIGAILGWAVRMTLANLASVGNLLLGALPVMLLTVLVFFNGPVWTTAATIGRPRLWLALTFLIVIAVAFLSSSTVCCSWSSG